MLDDDRVKCVECANKPGKNCLAPARADLKVDRYGNAEIGRQLANTPQRCQAFVARRKAVATT